MLKPYYTEDLLEAGCDEVGRGCLAGPVVAAAVILPKNYYHPLLNDSKKLSTAKRILLDSVIKEVAIAWAIGEATHEEIDQINIFNASCLAMHRAISQLEQLPQLLLIDGKYFNPYPNTPHQCIIDGDAQFNAIAAASIIAKTYRDAYMHQLSLQYPDYGWKKNVGYPTVTHRKAIQELGLTPYHRKSYKLL
ncbi:MAG: ribonuclease HII [Candidatus Amoebophilus sp.]